MDAKLEMGRLNGIFSLKGYMVAGARHVTMEFSVKKTQN